MVQNQPECYQPVVLRICSFVLFTFYAIRYTMDQANEKHSLSCNHREFLTNPQAPLLTRIKEILNSIPLARTKQTIIIAVSGGSDSICLLHILSTLLPHIHRIAVYIDHGLRPEETPAERKHVQSCAMSCKADFLHVSVDVRTFGKTHGLSPEEAARILRYRELESIRNKYNAACICVGHTADDQAEEVLLRLIRGSGSKGLSGMQLSSGRIIRPLLFETKGTLRSWLAEHDISFCEDSSNSDTRFLRNRIRLDLLPSLEEHYNPAIRKSLLRTASILREDDALLQKLMEESYPRVVQNKETTDTLILELSNFQKEPLAIKRRILEKICITLQTQISFHKIQLMLDLTDKAGNGELHLSNGLRANKQGDTIIFHYPLGKTPHRHSIPVTCTFQQVAIPSPGRYPVAELAHELCIQELSVLPHSPPTGLLFIDPDTLPLPLTLRPCRPGDRFHPLGAPGRKKVSRFLADRKIPAHKRNCHPVLVSGKTIIALPGLRIDHSFRVHPDSKHIWQLDWRPLSLSNLLLKNI